MPNIKVKYDRGYRCPKGHSVSALDQVSQNGILSQETYLMCRECSATYPVSALRTDGLQSFEERRALGRSMNIQFLIR
jgi:hypothetical protein